VAAPRSCPTCSQPLPRRPPPRFCGRCGARLQTTSPRPDARLALPWGRTLAIPAPVALALPMAFALAVASAVVAPWLPSVETVEAPSTLAADHRLQQQEPSPVRQVTTADLAGVWLQTSHPDQLGLVVAFQPDGSYRMDEQGELLHRPASSGTYRLDGHHLHLADVTGTGCPRGHRSVWTALLDVRDRLLIDQAPVVLDDGCPLDGDGTRTFRRVSPGDVRIAGSAGATSAQRDATLRELRGLWLQVADPGHLGLLIDFGADGSFTMDGRGRLGDDPEAHGTVHIAEGILTFWSRGSSVCPGSVGWQRRGSLPVSGELRIATTRGGGDGCPGTPRVATTFVRISPSSYASGPLFEPR
jgi:hypothetical protein